MSAKLRCLFHLPCCLAAAALAFECTAGTVVGAEPLRLENAVVTLIEQVDVPARAPGVLAELSVREGDRVAKGLHAGRVDDAEARLKAEHVELELAAAKAEAANELKMLAAQKGAEAAKAELQRAADSQAKYDKSISQTELARLRLAAEKGELEARQARHEIEAAKVAYRVKENESAAARQAIERHRLSIPLDGVVVEVRRRVGEWVEPGMPVLRVVRMDRLRVEAFLEAERVSASLAGSHAEFKIAPVEGSPRAYSGRITFVSPEVNPVNGQVRICAEVDNPEGSLRPGVPGELIIGAPAKDANVGRAQAGAAR